jgi:hypothetical protein
MVAGRGVANKGMVGLFSCIFKCCSEFFKGKTDDMVIQVHFVSSVKTDRLEGDSSGAYSKKSCNILG